MTMTDDDVRQALNAYAQSVSTSPPPISAVISPGPAPAVAAPRVHRRRRRVLVGVATTAAVVTAGLGVAASGLLDERAAEFIEDAMCGLDAADGRMVASAVDTLGNTVEFWVVDSAAGSGEVLVEKSADGSYRGGSMGCSPAERIDERPRGVAWATAPNETVFGQYTLIRLMGWAPQPTERVTVTFSDGTVNDVAVQPNGYFLHLTTVAPNENLDVVSIASYAADGTLLREGPAQPSSAP